MFSLLPQHLHQEPCGNWRATAWQWEVERWGLVCFSVECRWDRHTDVCWWCVSQSEVNQKEIPSTGGYNNEVRWSVLSIQVSSEYFIHEYFKAGMSTNNKKQGHRISFIHQNPQRNKTLNNSFIISLIWKIHSALNAAINIHILLIGAASD